MSLRAFLRIPPPAVIFRGLGSEYAGRRLRRDMAVRPNPQLQVAAHPLPDDFVDALEASWEGQA